MAVRFSIRNLMYNAFMINNILIVEDEWINAEFISDLVLAFGHNVIGIAKSAEDAIEIFTSKPCDLVLMDINIKGSTDGIQLAIQLNEIKEIPIVFITAFGDSQTIKDASLTNIYGFLVKPFNRSHIEAVLNVAIARISKEQKKSEKHSLNPSKIDLGFEYTYNLKTQTIYFKENQISLSKNESNLLFLFCSNYGCVLSADIIRTCVWGDKNVTDSTLRETILRIRNKIIPLVLENIRGVGYSLQKEKD
ncbi:MAG: response regulator [Sulfurimonas sp.]|nr:response regulator [Sulfurimonas sp.]